MSASSIFGLITVIQAAKKVVTRPKKFYQQMPKSGGYGNPLVFVVVMGIIAGLLAMVLPINGITSGFTALALPIIAVIGSFIAALIMYIIWKLMGSSENYETAYRCVAFASVYLPASMILAIVPYLGTLVAYGWWFVLMFFASIGVHGIEKQKAMIVIGVLGAILILMSLSGR